MLWRMAFCMVAVIACAAAADRQVLLSLSDGDGPVAGVLVVETGVSRGLTGATIPGWSSSAAAAGLDRAFSFKAPLAAPIRAAAPIDGLPNHDLLPPWQEAELVWYDLLTNQPAGSTTLRWSWRNDDRHAYLAVAWDDPDLDDRFDPATRMTIDRCTLRIDDGDGTWGPGDDERYVIPVGPGTLFRDEHHAGPDRVGDGLAYVRRRSADDGYEAEFLVPMDDDAAGEDASLVAGLRFNIALYDGFDLDVPSDTLEGGLVASLASGFDDPATWRGLPLVDHPAVDRPPRPADLGGMVAYVSTLDDPLGAIWLVDPDTGVKTRVEPTDPADQAAFAGFKRDNISLSNDHSRIAMTGFRMVDGQFDFAGTEIWVLAVDGSELLQVTDNTWLDGHPAWSPDDSQLLWARYAPGTSGAHIVVADADGGHVVDLTAGWHPDVGNSARLVEENDPEWLPDGRVLFKTNRWTPWNADGQSPTQHVLSVAVCALDGSGLTRLSTPVDAVDHDPMAAAGMVYWERLTAAFDYSQGTDAFYSPWHLYRAPVDGSTVAEPLLEDVWVNYLPVPSPDGRAVAYLKYVGFTEARLLDAEGRDLGRFIPDDTGLVYLDWKPDPPAPSANQ